VHRGEFKIVDADYAEWRGAVKMERLPDDSCHVYMGTDPKLGARHGRAVAIIGAAKEAAATANAAKHLAT
jgi:hypothetical protein